MIGGVTLIVMLSIMIIKKYMKSYSPSLQDIENQTQINDPEQSINAINNTTTHVAPKPLLVSDTKC